jgi:chaperonin GroEL
MLTGATLVSSSTGVDLKTATLKQLGQCKKVVVDAKSTTLVGTGATKANVEEHVAALRTQLEDVTLTVNDVTKLKTRIAKLASGVAIIRVGGSTEIEMVEKKYRIEDALNATRAAAEEGIVPGGGMALINAVKKLETAFDDLDGEESLGASIVMKACEAPIRRIVKNANKSSSIVINELDKRENDNLGYNILTDSFVDLVAVGVVDPVKVTRTALQHAASVAVTFLSLDAVICEENNNDKTK